MALDLSLLPDQPGSTDEPQLLIDPFLLPDPPVYPTRRERTTLQIPQEAPGYQENLQALYREEHPEDFGPTPPRELVRNMVGDLGLEAPSEEPAQAIPQRPYDEEDDWADQLAQEMGFQSFGFTPGEANSITGPAARFMTSLANAMGRRSPEQEAHDAEDLKQFLSKNLQQMDTPENVALIAATGGEGALSTAIQLAFAGQGGSMGYDAANRIIHARTNEEKDQAILDLAMAIPMVAAPLLGMRSGPVSKTQPSVADLIKRGHASEVPPPIPPEYAQRNFVTDAQGQWLMGPDGRPMPHVPPDKPYIAPAPGIEQTVAQAERPVVPLPVEPTAAERAQQVLDRRTEMLERKKELEARVAHGEPVQQELDQLQAEIMGPNNPVVHAPPREATGPVAETAVEKAMRRTGEPLRTSAEITAEGQVAPPQFPEAGAQIGIPSESARLNVKPPRPTAEEETLAKKITSRPLKLGTGNKRGGYATELMSWREAGKAIYKAGMDFHTWAAEMLARFGREVAEHLRGIWDDMHKLYAIPPAFRKGIKMGEPPPEFPAPLDLSKPENFDKVDIAVPVALRGKRALMTSTDSGGERHIGEFDPDLRVVPKLLDTAPKEETDLYRTKNILGSRADPKTIKGEKFGVRTYISYLAAEKGSGVANLCLFATDKCTEGCLGKGGNGRYDTVIQGRINKTKYFAYDPVTYMRQLDGEIVKAKVRAKKDGVELAVRLNGTSDVLWEKSGIMERHPDVQFYDYTKYPYPLRKNLPPNYHLTYSYTGTESSRSFSNTWNDHGVNTAVVFRDGMPAEFLGRPVIDGDVTDMRFKDPKGVIVGLHAKGKLRLRDKDTGNYIETNEFVYDTPPEDVAIPYFDPRQKVKILKNDMLGEEAINAMKDLAPRAGDLKYPRGNPLVNEEGLLTEQAKGLKLKAQTNIGGYTPLFNDLAEFGVKVFKHGMTAAQWADEMLGYLGDAVGDHLGKVWDVVQKYKAEPERTFATPKIEPLAPVTPKAAEATSEPAPLPYTQEAAKARNNAPVASGNTPPEEPNTRGSTHGVSEARTLQELGPGSVEPGVGAYIGSGLAYGRDYINKGGDPRAPIRRAKATGLVGRNDVGIVHAELERLRAERARAVDAYQVNPNDPALFQAFTAADDAQRAWRKELQPVLTKAGDTLREAQAASMPNADPSTYQGLADIMDEHFKGKRELNPQERTEMAKAARGVKQARKMAADEMTKIQDKLEAQVKAKGKKVMSPEELDADLKSELENQFKDCILNV